MRQAVFASGANVRVIGGEPGVGKTYFGCEIAEDAILSTDNLLGDHQKVLFLTFARNAVARIRETYVARIDDQEADRHRKQERIQLFRRRVRVDTFAGFFWWLAESYGRYIRGGSIKRLWFAGTRKDSDIIVPFNCRPCTFEDVENEALALMAIPEIRSLLSHIYPLVIVDEFQDVHDNLFNILRCFASNAKLILLNGPGQCIYRGIKKFEPEEILERCKKELEPQFFHLTPIRDETQRHSPAIRELIRQYKSGSVKPSKSWPTNLQPLSRFTRNGIPRKLETHVGIMAHDLKVYLKRTCPNRRTTIGILTSTNQGVAAIFDALKNGSQGFGLRPQRASLQFDDLILLQYGRAFLEALKGHWIAARREVPNVSAVAQALGFLFQHQEKSVESSLNRWIPLAKKMVHAIGHQQPPRGSLSRKSKLIQDLQEINKRVLCSTKQTLPADSPPTPFTKADKDLLDVLVDELIETVVKSFDEKLFLNLEQASKDFEKAMKQRIIFEKLGVSQSIQVMTIHKAKGREFDGVILVLEPNQKAMWRLTSRTADTELEDLYLVAISRPRFVFGLIAFNDVYPEAKPVVQKLLPRSMFDTSSGNRGTVAAFNKKTDSD